MNDGMRKAIQKVGGQAVRTSMRSMVDFALIVKAEVVRDLLFMKRYPLEPLSFLFFMYLILMSILLGFSQLMEGGVRSLNSEKMVLGYCLMQFVLATQMGWSGQIQNESQTGTLEQLSISGHSLGGVLLARGIAQMPRQMLSFFVLLSAYRWSLPGSRIDLGGTVEAIPVLIFLAFGIYGVAFLFAGLTLIFKRVGFFFQIINFGFLGLFWQDRAALREGGLAALLYDSFPLTMGMERLQAILVTGHRSVGASSWLAFAGVCAASAVIGYALFRQLEKKARQFGLLSQY